MIVCNQNKMSRLENNQNPGASSSAKVSTMSIGTNGNQYKLLIYNKLLLLRSHKNSFNHKNS